MLAIMGCVMPSFAQNAAPALGQNVAPEEQAALVQKAEAYLNGIKTLQARFAQMNNDGTILAGQFYLQRPGRLRFQYDAPDGDYIVADGLLIHYWDDTAKNYSNAPIGSTLADFLLKKHISLSGELNVTSVRRPGENKLVLTVVQRDNPEAGDLRLLFNENPMQLEKWRITDATGQVTETSLSDVQSGMKLDPTLFRFKPPKGYDKNWNGHQ